MPGGERGPCAELARAKPVQVVYGPGTFINSAVGEIQDQLKRRLDAKGAEAEKAADAARQARAPPGQAEGGAGAARALGGAARLRAVRARPAAAQPQVRARRRQDAEARRPRLRRHARVRPAARGDDAEGALRLPVPVVGVGGDPGAAQAGPERRASASARPSSCARRCGCPTSALRNAEGYTVTGVPVLAEDLSDALAGSVARLLLVALVVMAAVLALVFRRRLRLVPLAVALGAVALTFGLMALVGAPLTMASIAVLPVLLGLAVDYAIQYQARIPDPPTATRRGAGGARRGADDRDGRAGDGRGLPRAAALAGADGARVRRAARGRRRDSVRARADGRDGRAGGARRPPRRGRRGAARSSARRAARPR